MASKPTYEELEQRVKHLENEADRREQAEEALSESDRQFRQLAESSPFGVTITRPDLTFEYFNPKFTELFGYTIEDLPDKQSWFERAYPDEEYWIYSPEGRVRPCTGPSVRAEIVCAWQGENKYFYCLAIAPLTLSINLSISGPGRFRNITKQ
ncbi:MAG: PAS domain S-box protein [Deltaproteobacteria bacterium]|nr:PAS domain S-box protein [Deltaproteobacteria bacterium]